MVTFLLLILIYFAFISLGLPDSLLGVAWPAIQTEWGLSLDAAGLVSMLITGSTIVSSFLSGHIIKKIGTGKVTFLSCLMTGCALLGFSLSSSYYWLLLLALPLGFGGGTVDTALNNYVALHFKSHHMNWLHSFWGVGATLGPIIMAQALSGSLMWRSGYRTIAFIQLSLSALLLLSLPLWQKHQAISKAQPHDSGDESVNDKQKGKGIFRIRGIKFALMTFMFYCAVELSIGLWGSSFLIQAKRISIDTAAYWITLYYGSITAGRFISGFISFKLSNKQMIRLGAVILLVGAVLLVLPLPSVLLVLPFILLGLGLSPIFPAMLHETPNHFGKQNSQIIIGYQMAFAYMGSAVFPPLFGVIMKNTSMVLFPFLLLAGVIIVFLSSEKLSVSTKGKQ